MATSHCHGFGNNQVGLSRGWDQSNGFNVTELDDDKIQIYS